MAVYNKIGQFRWFKINHNTHGSMHRVHNELSMQGYVVVRLRK